MKEVLKAMLVKTGFKLSTTENIWRKHINYK